MRWAWLAAALLPAAGCFETEPAPTAAPSTPAAPAATARPAAPAAATLQLVTFAAWEAARQNYRPRIVVVDFWATWCAPCLERFPEMVELQRRYADRGVQFVSLSLDDHNDPGAVEAARAFLAQSGAAFDHYLLQENMLAAFERLDLLGIPAVVLYGPEGRERARLTGDDPNDQFDHHDVEAAIEGLLAEGS